MRKTSVLSPLLSLNNSGVLVYNPTNRKIGIQHKDDCLFFTDIIVSRHSENIMFYNKPELVTAITSDYNNVIISTITCIYVLTKINNIWTHTHSKKLTQRHIDTFKKIVVKKVDNIIYIYWLLQNTTPQINTSYVELSKLYLSNDTHTHLYLLSERCNNSHIIDICMLDNIVFLAYMKNILE